MACSQDPQWGDSKSNRFDNLYPWIPSHSLRWQCTNYLECQSTRSSACKGLPSLWYWRLHIFHLQFRVEGESCPSWKYHQAWVCKCWSCSLMRQPGVGYLWNVVEWGEYQYCSDFTQLWWRCIINAYMYFTRTSIVIVACLPSKGSIKRSTNIIKGIDIVLTASSWAVCKEATGLCLWFRISIEQDSEKNMGESAYYRCCHIIGHCAPMHTALTFTLHFPSP